MAIRCTFTPPKVDAATRMRAAKALAEHEAADELLAQSQPLVPVLDGVLKDSGRVVDTPAGAAVTYGSDTDGSAHHAPSNQYVIKQHEDHELNHPGGGESGWLYKSMNAPDPTVLEAAAVSLRKALM